MNAHVSNIARTCYFELRRLASIRRFLTSTATATLVSTFVLSRIDYCHHCHHLVSFEDILVLFSLQRLNCILDHYAYVHGLAMLWLCIWSFLEIH